MSIDTDTLPLPESKEVALSIVDLQQQKDRARIWEGIKFDYAAWEDYVGDRKKHCLALGRKNCDRIALWLGLAKQYTLGEEPDLGRVNSPPFDELSFQKCDSVSKIIERMLSDFWMPGDSFFWDDMCVINKSRDASAWVLIKGGRIVGDLLIRDRWRQIEDIRVEFRKLIDQLG